MSRSTGLIVSMVLLAACGAPTPGQQQFAQGHQPDEEAAVLAVLDRFVTAISESDLEAQAAMQTPDGMTYQWRPAEGGGMHITARPNSYWTNPFRDDGHAYRERYWSPTVMIRGGIAVVWAPCRLTV